MNEIETKAVADGSWHNRERMAAGTACGCFHCQAVFLAEEVTRWVDDDLTALCPHCGVDAVVPGVTDPATLRDMHDRAFAQSQRPSAAEWNAASLAPPRASDC